MLTVKLLSSLDKVFFEGPVDGFEVSSGKAMCGEKFSFQVAFKGSYSFKLTLSTPSLKLVNIYKVGQIVSSCPTREGHDDDILKGVPGFYPDILYPVSSPIDIYGTDREWHSFWIEIPLTNQDVSGVHHIEVIVESSDDYQKTETVKITKNFALEVLPVTLPKQDLIHTEWIHTDGLVTYYGIEVFSDRYWNLVEKNLKMAVDHGVNMILTPIVTPPLDTEIGGERPTIQLVQIEKKGPDYKFDFSLLQRWSDICRNVGIEYLEMSHLFTQWGAKSAPKIEVIINGKTEKMFGWHTDSNSVEYRGFLSQFIPELINWIEKNGWSDNVYFHTSDEPTMSNIDSYRKASEYMRSLVAGLPIIDALSDFEFYKEGLVDIPIPANDHIDQFIDNKVDNLWTYYCVSQNYLVSNRFFDMPSYRNRIIGYQLYKYDIKGFLHWGYNFYFTQYSKRPVDPFSETDAGGVFPSGDSFLVYPGESGPLPSIRLKVLNEGIQDLRALKLLESFIGKDKVLEIVESNISPIKFNQYPRSSKWQLEIRNTIYEKIKEYVIK